MQRTQPVSGCQLSFLSRKGGVLFRGGPGAAGGVRELPGDLERVLRGQRRRLRLHGEDQQSQEGQETPQASSVYSFSE